MRRGDASWEGVFLLLVVTVVLLLVLNHCHEEDARACEQECAADGMRANPVVTEYGVQCICTPYPDAERRP